MSGVRGVSELRPSTETTNCDSHVYMPNSDEADLYRGKSDHSCGEPC